MKRGMNIHFTTSPHPWTFYTMYDSTLEAKIRDSAPAKQHIALD